MKKLVLTLAAIAEMLTGLVLLVSPSIVAQLLFGADVSGVGTTMSRVLGISLIAFRVACWPGNAAGYGLLGMLIYSVLVALYLVYVGTDGGERGVLLWPAVAFHAVFGVLLTRAWVQRQKTLNSREKTGLKT